jgi:hypothetical protein
VVHGRVGNVMRVMVHRGRRRGCRDIAPPCRCLLPSCGHSAVCAISRGGGRRRSCARAVRRQTRATGRSSKRDPDGTEAGGLERSLSVTGRTGGRPPKLASGSRAEAQCRFGCNYGEGIALSVSKVARVDSGGYLLVSAAAYGKRHGLICVFASPDMSLLFNLVVDFHDRFHSRAQRSFGLSKSLKPPSI